MRQARHDLRKGSRYNLVEVVGKEYRFVSAAHHRATLEYERDCTKELKTKTTKILTDAQYSKYLAKQR